MSSVNKKIRKRWKFSDRVWIFLAQHPKANKKLKNLCEHSVVCIIPPQLTVYLFSEFLISLAAQTCWWLRCWLILLISSKQPALKCWRAKKFTLTFHYQFLLHARYIRKCKSPQVVQRFYDVSFIIGKLLTIKRTIPMCRGRTFSCIWNLLHSFGRFQKIE